MILKTKLLGHVYEFKSVKDALAKANEEKSGDRLAGIAAENAEERVAAKVVVANLTLADLRANPAVPYEEDEVTRIIQDDVNEKIYDEIKHWTVARAYGVGFPAAYPTSSTRLSRSAALAVNDAFASTEAQTG